MPRSDAMLALTLFLAFSCVSAGPQPVAAKSTLAVLELERAIAGEEALLLHLERPSDRFTNAFATAPDFNQASHLVDASGLKLDGPILSGEVHVTVQPDLWHPKDRRPFPCTFTLDAEVDRGTASGTYRGSCGGLSVEGRVSGRVEPRPTLPDPARFEIVLVKPLSRESTHWGNMGHLSFTLIDGRPVAPRLQAPNNTTYADFSARIRNIDVNVSGSSLTTTIRWDLRPAGRRFTAGEHVVRLEGRWIGNAVGGSFATVVDGRPVAEDRFVGKVQPATIPDPREAFWCIELHGAAPDGRPVWIHVDSAQATFGEGLAFAPLFNHETHDVDTSGLELEGNRLSGRIGVTIHPDPYVPKDGKPIACEYSLEASLQGGGITGTFHGAFGSENVEGSIAGEYLPRPDGMDPVKLSLKMEQGVTGGAPWHNRCYLGLTLKNGRLLSGSFTNNKGGWEGRLDTADLRIEEGSLKGTIHCTVESGRVKTGTYEFRLDGVIVGSFLKGTYRTRLADRPVRDGRFMGKIEPAPEVSR
jgi:hypothetical protein